ncbi:uncharacterized protein E0L32_008936 [Thyridium curvatum]|uniref:Rhodopsin domain-containing protein n=1 Tax=Thyridium curvatum TaxID=1093900 RepID=A0A507ATU2_9PEZI|nr:uncharacterized protein E0L32_008936 [Thyridium curvatum]TPX09914.1 hypothetical protein E0L32_008936 [Thyridium curvatum]
MAATPPATAPNYIVGESRSGDIIAIVTAMTALSTVVLAVRLWSRIGLQGVSPGADDWTIIAAWVFSVAFTVDVSTQTAYGLGKHLGDLPPTTNFSASLELFYFGEAIYYITVSLTKISILCLYLRLIPQRSYRYISYGLMVFVGLTGFCCVLAGVFQCNPIHKAWNPELEGTCFNQVALFMSNAGLNIAQDIIIYLFPIKRFWEIQLPRKQRIALILVFVVGAFVCITGILRLQSLTLASVSADVTWDNYGSAIWSSVEANVGIVCASLVHLKPLIIRYAPSLLNMTRNTRLADERSGDDSGLRSGGRSGLKGNKQSAMNSAMELDDSEESSIIRSARQETTHGYHTHANSSPTHSRGMSRDGSRIHKTTQIQISYVDANPYGGPRTQGI